MTFPLHLIGKSKRKYRDDDEGEENYEDEDGGDGDSPIISKHWACTVSFKLNIRTYRLIC